MSTTPPNIKTKINCLLQTAALNTTMPYPNNQTTLKTITMKETDVEECNTIHHKAIGKTQHQQVKHLYTMRIHINTITTIQTIR